MAVTWVLVAVYPMAWCMAFTSRITSDDLDKVSLTARLDSLELTVATMQSQTKATEQNHALAMSSVLEKLGTTTKELQDMKRAFASLKTDHVATQHEIEILKSQLMSALNQIANLSYCSEVSKGNETFSSEFELIKMDLNVSAMDLETVKSDVRDLKADIRSSGSNMNILTSQFNRFKADMNTTQTSVIGTVNRMKTQIASTQNKMAKLQSKVHDTLVTETDRKCNQNGTDILPVKGNARPSDAIVFQATLGQLDDRHVVGNSTIPFHDILLNTGDGYKSRTGIFTTQVPGVYFFWTNVDSLLTDMDIAIVKNGHILVGGENGYETRVKNPDKSIHVSLSVAVSLQMGDKVSVRVSEDQQLFYNGYSSFGGMLILRY